MAEHTNPGVDDDPDPRVAAHDQAAHLRERMTALAGAIADSEDSVAAALEESARLRPEDAERLGEAAQQAREYAERERRFVARADPDRPASDD